MLKFNQMLEGSELESKITEFASNACISKECLADLDKEQLQTIATVYSSIEIKDILEQSLDAFFEGIGNFCPTMDDAARSVLDIIVETKDLESRLLLKEFYYLFKILSDDSGQRMMALRNLSIYSKEDFNEKIVGLRMGIFKKELGGMK